MKSATKTAVGWLNARQAALYLDITDKDGNPDMHRFYMWKFRHRPRTHRLGRSLRFRQVDLDAAVEVEPQVMGEDSPLVLIAGGKR